MFYRTKKKFKKLHLRRDARKNLSVIDLQRKKKKLIQKVDLIYNLVKKKFLNSFVKMCYQNIDILKTESKLSSLKNFLQTITVVKKNFIFLIYTFTYHNNFR